MLDYAKTIRIGPEAYTFGVSQSASYPGTGLAALNAIVPLRYWKAVTHQCSCIWLFPHTTMVPPLGPKQAQKRSEKLARQIAQDILAGKRSPKAPPKNVLNAAENKAWPLIAKKKIAAFKVSERCVACGQCVRLCPHGNIRLENGRAVIGRDCIQCLSCLQYCPQSAISIGAVTDKRKHYHNPNITADELSRKIISIP